MTEPSSVPRRSDLSQDELIALANRLRKLAPKMYQILIDLPAPDPDLYEGVTGGLFGWLKDNEPSLREKRITEVSAVHLDLINFLAGREFR
jgi:hypothetical protein